MLVPAHVEVARRLCGQPISWSDYARAILKQAHENFTNYGSNLGTGPWYVTIDEYPFTMTPFDDYYPRFSVRSSEDLRYWVFEVIP